MTVEIQQIERDLTTAFKQALGEERLATNQREFLEKVEKIRFESFGRNIVAIEGKVTNYLRVPEEKVAGLREIAGSEYREKVRDLALFLLRYPPHDEISWISLPSATDELLDEWENNTEEMQWLKEEFKVSDIFAVTPEGIHSEGDEMVVIAFTGDEAKRDELSTWLTQHGKTKVATDVVEIIMFLLRRYALAEASARAAGDEALSVKLTGTEVLRAQRLLEADVVVTQEYFYERWPNMLQPVKEALKFMIDRVAPSVWPEDLEI